jgi:hypothetical protein
MNQKKVMALEIARRLEQRGLIDAAAHWYALANQVSVSLADSPPNPKRRLLSHGQNIGKEDRSPVGINPGTTPWSTVGGRARVNLATGRVSFDVDGLVLNGKLVITVLMKDHCEHTAVWHLVPVEIEEMPTIYDCDR